MQWVSFIPPKSRRTALQAAQEDSEAVLITGATGSGKSALARWIHQNSPRSMQPFVSLKAGQVTAEKILEAKMGTLFFAEFESLLAHEKELLLHLLKTSSLLRPANSQEPKHLIRARIIFSAFRPLDGLIHFIPQFEIRVPDLSNRPEEFEDITLTLLREIAREVKKEYLQNLDESAWNRLKTYSWPGNLRELRNALTIAIHQAQGPEITAADFPKLELSHQNLRATREEFDQDLLDKIIQLARKEFISKPE